MRLYTLKGKRPIPAKDVISWGKWFENAERHVANDRLGVAHISTVFLGLDHSFSLKKKVKPILFETMIFGGDYNSYQRRYSTWKQAEAGHKAALKLVKSGKKPGLGDV